MAVSDINGLQRAELGDDPACVNMPVTAHQVHGSSLQAPLFRYVVHRDFSTCESEWRAFETDAIATPFQSFDWLINWWHAYQSEEQHQSLELNIVLAYRSDRLVLILPLIIEPYKNVRRLSWLCSHLNDYNAPLVGKDYFSELNAETIDQIWSDVMHVIADVDILFLAKQPKHVAGNPNAFYSYRAYDYYLAYHTAAIMGDWQAYYTGRRKGRSRSRLKSKEKFMRVEASMTIREVTDPNERSDMVLKTIQWKRAQVAVSGAIDPFADVETNLFFDTIARSTALNNSFRVFSLDVAGEPIAGAFGLNTEESFILYQSAYKIGEHTRYSPGVLLLIHMMEKMADEGRQVFDFSIGDEPYKFDWANKHGRLSVTIRTNTLKGRLAKIVFISKLNLKGWIKRSDQRFELAKSLHRRMRQVSRG